MFTVDSHYGATTRWSIHLTYRSRTVDSWFRKLPVRHEFAELGQLRKKKIIIFGYGNILKVDILVP